MRTLLICLGLIISLPSFADPLKAGESAPCLTLSTQAPGGQIGQTSTCNGGAPAKKLVIEFFGLNCRICVLKLPFFEQLSQQLAAKATFRLVDTDTDAKSVADFFRTRNRAGYELALDPKGDALDAFGFIETPAIAVIDSGKIKFIQEGFTSEAEEEQAVKKALGL